MKKPMNPKISISLILLSMLASTVFFQNCSKVAVSDISSVSSSGLIDPQPTDLPVAPTIMPSLPVALKIDPAAGYSCSPFGTVTVASDKAGLKAELRYIDPTSSMTAAQKNSILATQYFIDNPIFIKVPEAVYLSDVNVPTRIFTSGFSTSANSLIKDKQGNVLIEYFALKMDTILKLGPNDLEGYYELSTLSDDGTLLQMYENDKWVDLINNDGAHSTKMGCMNQRVLLTKQSRIPLRLYYNQGPRTQIANVMVWNYRGAQAVGDPTDLASDAAIHTYCGKAGNDNFWISATSLPGPWIIDILGRSEEWKIVRSDNFQLPNNEVNPCFYNTYDLKPALTSDDGKIFNLTLSEAASVTANLYLVNADSTKSLIQTLSLDNNIKHTFQFATDLNVNRQYKLELLMAIPNKQLQVRTEYSLSFAPVN